MPKAVCKECEREYEVACADLNWTIQSYPKHTEGMGAEFHHTAEWEENCLCGNGLRIDFLVVEYPEGVVELREIDPSDCDFHGDCPAPMSFR